MRLKGAKVVLGGKRASQGGSFFEPTVLTDVTGGTFLGLCDTYSITSSPRARIDCDIARPSASAVFKLTTSSLLNRQVGGFLPRETAAGTSTARR